MANSLRKKSQNSPTFSSFFTTMTDPRRTDKGKFLYPLEEILFLVISAVISGADNWTTISKFGKAKLSWLRQYFPYQEGTPSHDILGELFARLDHHQFSTCFTDWVTSISSFTKGQVVAIDGKTICNSGDKESKKTAIHVVSAYASANHLCLGQKSVSEKSNEITAIPELLSLLEIKGCIVTIDAMGCQKKIAEQIIEQRADYILMVKDNQKELKEQVKKMFERNSITDTNTQVDAGHGRVETRVCDVVDDLTFMDNKENWRNLSNVYRISSERFDKKTSKLTNQVRYYIGSGKYCAEKINKSVRQHWAIENNLHWSLDVVFKEDESLKKKGNSAKNYNIILKMALAMLNRENSKKASKPVKRMNAAWDDTYRDKVLKS